MSALFTPFKLKDVSLRNRIAIPPMCQYTAVDGLINDWHRVHLAGLARGGAGLVIVEATAVSPEGRITPGCTGLWNDKQAQAFAPVVASIKAAGAVPGIQIAHAGRKATPTAQIPWAPAFLTPIAERVRREAQLPVASAWGIDTPELANRCVENGQLDLVMVGRAHLADPHWPYSAARKLGIDRASWTLPAPYAHWLERYAVAD
jgi:2,4-dienoyl-CoA reductase-like NADH-dependent reductase (Old Yellow Enzyme family)